MEQIAFTMQLKPDQAAEYERRHDAIWPELVTLLKDSGIRDYSIFLEEATGTLFAVLRRAEHHGMESLPGKEIMRRWWSYMAELMATNPDGSPLTSPLRRVFQLP
jgi:L-rhamnose mutarotase